jgi:large repetitive protein
VTDPDACSPTKMTTTSTQINYDVSAMASTTDDVEVTSPVWTPTSAAGPMDIWSRRDPMAPNHVWTGVDFGSPSDASLVSPPLDVATNQSFILTFKYRHQFEQSAGTNWDGGVIEVSTDKGMNWNDISMYGAVPYYTGTIGDFGPPPGAVNALKGRKGFVGQSPSWPAMDTATITMGNTLAGQSVQIRFRVASDDEQAEYGWDIDDIGFQGINNKPFPTITPNSNPCTALPVVDAGPYQTVFSGDLVTLDGSKSSHPKMLPLTFTWSEQSGPPIMLTGANMAKSTFIAPPVTMDTPMTFQLSVSDGKGSASATTNVLVKPAMDGTPDEPFELGGCGCTTVGSSPAATLSPLVAFALLALRRRRRAGGRSRA